MGSLDRALAIVAKFQPLPGGYNELAYVIAAAIDEEREACAKIAEETNDCCDCLSIEEVRESKYHNGSNAAAAIRART